VIAPGRCFLSELGVALLLFMVGLEFSLGDFWLARRTVLMAGALQMIAVAPPLILLDVAGQPGQSAALLGTAAAMSSTALVSRQLADQGELTTRHGRSAIAVLVFQDLASVPAGLAGDLGARRVAEDRACAARSIRCCCCSRQRPRLAPSVAWPAGLGGAAGPRGIVRARLLVRGGGCRRCCARGRRIRRPGPSSPGWCWARATWHHMESHLRPFRDVLSGVFFVTIGLQLDAAQILSAPLAVLAWLVVLVPVKILLNTLALRATRLSALDAWRTGIALGHGGEFALLLLGTVLQQHLIPATVVNPCWSRWCSAWPGTATDPPSRCARFLSRTGGVIQPPG
jgi:CPA2 family monovalent cation:H+ antiporter-2